MLFRVPGEVFARIAQAAHSPTLDAPEPDRPYLAGVRIERDASMRLFVVATNAKIMAVEFLDFNTDDAPGGVTVHASLAGSIMAGETLVVSDGSIWVEDATGVPLRFFGPEYIVSATYPNWRNVVPKPDANGVPERTKGHGVMAYRGHHIDRLAKSSPSGILVFPDWINDGSGAILVRALVDEVKSTDQLPNWFGLFVGQLQYGTMKQVPGAIVPDWLK